jgi:hypothetical protein
LSSFLAFYCYVKDAEFITYDKNKVNSKKIEGLGGKSFTFDIFNNKEKISNVMVKNKRVLLLCDNGNKIKEFNYFSNFLKPNDYIMSHDYFKFDNCWKPEHPP